MAVAQAGCCGCLCLLVNNKHLHTHTHTNRRARTHAHAHAHAYVCVATASLSYSSTSHLGRSRLGTTTAKPTPTTTAATTEGQLFDLVSSVLASWPGLDWFLLLLLLACSGKMSWKTNVCGSWGASHHQPIDCKWSRADAASSRGHTHRGPRKTKMAFITTNLSKLRASCIWPAAVIKWLLINVLGNVTRAENSKHWIVKDALDR